MAGGTGGSSSVGDDTEAAPSAEDEADPLARATLIEPDSELKEAAEARSRARAEAYAARKAKEAAAAAEAARVAALEASEVLKKAAESPKAQPMTAMADALFGA